MRHSIAVAVVFVTLAGVGCGGGGSDGGSTTPTAPSGGAPTGGGGGGTTTSTTITIGADGRVSPASLTVAPGSRVTFVNNHNRPHDMSADPHPEHTECPEINQVGFLQPGQSKASGNLNTVRRCGFHDHNEPSNNALVGSITIQ